MISPCCTYETFRVKNKDLDLEFNVCRKCGLPWVVTEEEWASVVGFPLYEVSTIGEVRRSPKKIQMENGRNKCYKAKVLKQADTPNKYKTVCLNAGGAKYTAQVHKLVAETWVLNPHGYKEVDHVTGNLLDNSYLNLKWIKDDTSGNN